MFEDVDKNRKLENNYKPESNESKMEPKAMPYKTDLEISRQMDIPLPEVIYNFCKINWIHIFTRKTYSYACLKEGLELDVWKITPDKQLKEMETSLSTTLTTVGTTTSTTTTTRKSTTISRESDTRSKSGSLEKVDTVKLLLIYIFSFKYIYCKNWFFMSVKFMQYLSPNKFKLSLGL